MFSQTAKLLPVKRCVQYSAVERSSRGCTSSLFITGDKANESCSVLTPYIDLNDRFKDAASLVRNVQCRGMSVNIEQLQTSWTQFQNLKKYKLSLERERSSNAVKFKAAHGQATRLVNELKAKGVSIKEKLKIVSKELWDVEKKAVVGGLSLPNDINPETPVNGEVKVVHQFGEKPDDTQHSPNHIEIAEKLGIIEYYDSSYYFLKEKAAHFEMGISYLFMDSFKNFGFIPMSNSDFGKSIVVEGAGLDPRDASSVFTMEMESDSNDHNARLHLVGGASIVSFCAYHTKTITDVKNLPLRYVAVGRHYNPGNDKGLHGLFSTWQSSAVESYVVAADSAMALEEFKMCLQKTIALYESLGYHFRVEYLPPKSLRPWESLHASFQMYSANLKQYIEVGSWSLCDDYISKRLLMCCQTKPSEPLRFNHVISGTIVSVPRLLGCVLESNSGDFEVPAIVTAAIM